MRPFTNAGIPSDRCLRSHLTPSLLFLAIVVAGCTDSPVEPEPLEKVVSRPVFALAGPATALDVGRDHACAIGADGIVACWGGNLFGQSLVPPALGAVTAVTTGGTHTCALKVDGSGTCWGDNSNGQSNLPAGLAMLRQLSAGHAHTCAVKGDGSAACWGFNQFGQTDVPATLGSVIQVSAGGNLSCAIKNAGDVLCWGRNDIGQAVVPASLGSALQVSVGADHSCALKIDGGVACWGFNGFGQTSVPAGLAATQVSVGQNHSCALKTDGKVACWGFSSFSQTLVPAGLDNVVRVEAGGNQTCATKNDGTITCWGSPSGNLLEGSFSAVSAGWLGSGCALRVDGQTTCWGEPGVTRVPASLGNATKIAAGGVHACALSGDGSIRCWGNSAAFVLTPPTDLGSATDLSAGPQFTCAIASDSRAACWGINDKGQTNVPTDLGTVTQVSAGFLHACAVKTDGNVRCWGNNSAGQANVPATLNGVTYVSAGGTHSCALKSDGAVVCWGFNALGATTVPPNLGPVTQVSTGNQHTCALSGSGTVVCWGSNPRGQTSVPTDLGPAIRISAAADQTCAVKLDNTVECWGHPTITTHGPEASPGATPAGSGVSVSPIDQSTGEPAPVSLNFSNVSASGTTTVTSGTVGTSGPPAPSGFRLGSPPTFYDVQTTAMFTGPVELCFDYSGASYGNESKLKLLHHENGVWTDVTTSLNTESKIICGTVTSLSPFLVAEENVAPIVTALSLPDAPVALGTTVSATAAFIDGNPNDTHTANLDWNDGTTSIASISQSAGTGSASGSHTYSAPGVFTVAASVSDGDLTGARSSISDEPAYIVVYDPSSGFVTGGGWFDSPAGACLWSGCASDGSSTGRASFGFVSRYRPGASIPTGNTEFQFKAGDLRFQSTSYHWLVVAGARAQYKGEGEITGDAASYGFLLTAIDGAIAGGGEADRFRIKIWNLATGAIVYDNQISQLEDSGAATVIGGGSIVIHK